MRTRRSHERPVRLIHVLSTSSRESGREGTWRRDEYDVDPAGSWTRADACLEPGVHTAVLLELERDRALLTTPSTTTSIGPNGSGRLARAAGLAAAAESELQRDLDRLRRCEHFVVLADLLAGAESRSDVFEALVEHLPGIVPAWKAVVFHRPADRGNPIALSAIGGEELGLAEARWQGLSGQPLPAVALLDREAVAESEDPLATLGRAVFDRTSAIRLACAGIEDAAIAVVAERRTGRDFSPQDWDMLRVASRQAAAALDRLG